MCNQLLEMYLRFVYLQPYVVNVSMVVNVKEVNLSFTRMCTFIFRVVTSPFGWFKAQQQGSACTSPIGDFL
jgi:hypothetical protein